MRITINGKEAVIKSGSTFEFISENRYFTGSDSYTLAMEFPLAGCPQNQRIFGHINRIDIEAKQYIFDCEIRSGKFYKSGSITITGIGDKTVKCQFLEGRSVQNYDDTLDKIYINELNLGSWPDIYSSNSVAEQFLSVDNGSYVALPWVNNSSGNVQNEMVWNSEYTVLNWSRDFTQSSERRVSFQPYMIFIFKRIFEILDYKIDIDAWIRSKWKDLLICNTVPGAWDKTEWSFSLPHWTIDEFLDELEKLMNCSFEVDNISKSIKMSFPSTASASQNVINISAINEFNATKTEEDESEYEESMGKKYADSDGSVWTEYTTSLPKKVLEHQKTLGPGMHKVTFAVVDARTLDIGIDDNCYNIRQDEYIYRNSDFCFNPRNTNDFYTMKGKMKPISIMAPIPELQFYAQKVGEFAEIEPKANGESKELRIVPVIIDEVEFDFLPFLECGELKDDSAIYEDWDGTTSRGDYYIRKYNEIESSAVYDKIYVAFWNHNIREAITERITFETKAPTSSSTSSRTKRMIPHPVVSNYNPAWIENGVLPKYIKIDESSKSKYSLALTASNVVNKEIDALTKYEIKFIANDIPDVGSIFEIKGQLFLCKKISATISENGMSQMLKGEFYKIIS